MNRVVAFLCNLLWFISCIPGWVRFRRALRHPQRTQTAILRRLLRRNRDTEYGRQHGLGACNGWDDFQKLPVTGPDDYAEALRRIRAGEKNILTADPVTMLQPTSGSSSTPKMIPHTANMAAQVCAALDAWIGDLFLRYPDLLNGRHYWAISPASSLVCTDADKVPVGFLDDAAYFGAYRRAFVDRVMAVPSEVRQIPSMEANQYVTLLFLLRTKSLRLISVWHPSFLTLLIDVMRANWTWLISDIGMGGIHPGVEMPRKLRESLSSRLPAMPRRHRELLHLRSDDAELCQKVWPRLNLISCWCDGAVKQDLATIEKVCPHARIQPKGLMATEGVLSIPFRGGSDPVCAAASHVLEFEDALGTVHPLWDIKPGTVYETILTTAGGHYRYRLGDRVEVAGYLEKTPCLRFLGRGNTVSDLVGEKIHLTHAEQILNELSTVEVPQSTWMTLVPSSLHDKPCYKLLIEPGHGSDPESTRLGDMLETRMCENYHYRHARELGQLGRASIVSIARGARERYREFMAGRGAPAGTVKYPALCLTPGVEQCLTNGDDCECERLHPATSTSKPKAEPEISTAMVSC